MSDQWKIAVLLPCHNEEAAIAQTIEGFRAALPTAVIYVYDNASTDQTAEVAARAGAVVRKEPLKGKGNVVRRMFADIEADIYVLADGDATYDASAAPALIEELENNQADMVVGVRKDTGDASRGAGDSYRRGHRTGNRLLTGLVSGVFGRRFSDILSGYRVMSRRFVKTFPSLSRGFEIETELTVHALEIRAPVSEVDTNYHPRPEGSASKLNTFQDGFRILGMIANLTREERPIAFFGLIAAALFLFATLLGVPVILEYLSTGLVLRQPTWILAVSAALAGLHLFSVGLVLETVTRGRREAKRLAYLAEPR
ncbi:MAG: glycosyltransferase family 2 protein [Hyphomonadaceae bacterium]|nr:glycosyltransferase family 2 protein [Hyphomonadaceae bacterium]